MIRNLSTGKFYKLGLALALFIVLLSIFSVLMREVHRGNTLLFDEALLRSIYMWSSPSLDNLFLLVTDLGGFVFIAIVTALILVVLLRQSRKYLALFVLLAVAGAGIINIGLKTLVGRDRPSLWVQLISESSYSFPSGHAMASSILGLCVVLVLWQTKYRLAAIVGTIAYVLLVGLSRMYLGVHYPSDVIGGWIVSSAWFMTVGAMLYGHAWRRKRLHTALERKD